jgi:dTDP-4-dehydrorhamnose reductase
MSEAKDSARKEGAGNTSLADHESFTLLDITQYDQFLAACEGVDTVVHLAATPGAPDDPEGFYGSLLPLNVIGTYNAFAAASAAGCKRIVFASSVNAVLGYVGNNEDGVNPAGGWSSPKDGVYTPGRVQYHADGVGEGSGNRWDAPVWPVNVYGATKCWGEALARTFSTSHGLSCICVRLGGFPADINGNPAEIPLDAFDKVSNAVSYRDAAQVFGKCVDVADDTPFLIVAGISRHDLSHQDVQHTIDSIGCECLPMLKSPRSYLRFGNAHHHCVCLDSAVLQPASRLCLTSATCANSSDEPQDGYNQTTKAKAKL